MSSRPSLSVAASALPRPTGRAQTWKPDPFSTPDIVASILASLPLAQAQTRDFARHFVSPHDLWRWVRTHVRYRADREGLEQLKLPARLVGRERVGDCKSMSLLISATLSNLGIANRLRFVSYADGGPFTHVYVMARERSRWTPVDAVHHAYGEEVRWNYAQDYDPAARRWVTPPAIAGTGDAALDNLEKTLFFAGLAVVAYRLFSKK